MTSPPDAGALGGPGDGTVRRIHAYLEADARYGLNPIPAPIDAASAVAFTVTQLVPTAGPDRLRRLARLVALHDLTATAPAWEKLLAVVQNDPTAAAKSAWCIFALAWVGDKPAQEKAQRSFVDVLDKADPEKFQDELAEAAFALATDRALAALGTWIERRASELDGDAARKRDNAELARNLRIRADQLRQTVRIQIPRWQRALGVMSRVLAMQATQRAAKLAALYAETDDESDAPLVWWAACRLVRLPFRVHPDGRRAPDPGVRRDIIEAFLSIARDRERSTSGDQDERDMTREAALHAAAFFGGQLPEPERAWLAGRRDQGVNLLVLRPNYEYPASPGPEK